MKAVNLIPADSRRSRSAGRSGPTLTRGGFGPAQFVVAALVVVVVLVLLRVLADNTVNNKKATLAAARAQVVTEQATASKLQIYVTFVQAAQQREQQVREIAEQRFPWKRTFDQISHVLPATTSLTSIGGSTTATATTNSAGTAVSGPTFTLAGCANTKDQNGVATLLRRLSVLTGVSNVGFQSSTRSAGCGNSFALALTFAAPGGSSTATAGSTSDVPGTTTTTTTGSAATAPGSTTTTGATG